MNQLSIDPDELAERVESGLKRQKRITRITLTVVSIGLFILFNIIAWGIATGASDSGDALGGMVMLTAGWFITLLYLVILMVMDFPKVEKSSRARLTSRIMGEMVQESLYNTMTQPKRKREEPNPDLVDGEAMTIGDDGELIPDDAKTQQQTRR